MSIYVSTNADLRFDRGSRIAVTVDYSTLDGKQEIDLRIPTGSPTSAIRVNLRREQAEGLLVELAKAVSEWIGRELLAAVELGGGLGEVV